MSTVGLSDSNEANIVCFDVICVSDTSGKLKKLKSDFETKLRTYLRNSITVSDPSKTPNIHVTREKRINDVIAQILSSVTWDIDIMDLPSKLSSDLVTLICEPVILRPQLVILSNGTFSTISSTNVAQDGITASFKVKYRDLKDTLYIPMEVMLLKSIMSHTSKIQSQFKQPHITPVDQENISPNIPLQPLTTPRGDKINNLEDETPKGLAALK